MSDNTTASQSPEAMIEALQSGELGDLLNRVKEAQGKLAELREQQGTAPQQGLHPQEIAGINSLIIHDLLDIRGSHAISADMQTMIDAVLKAAIAQHGRMLDVRFTQPEQK